MASVNADVNCRESNGGCSHFCVASECICPPCWELSEDNVTCIPASDKVSVACSASGMSITVDECVYKGDEMTLSLNDESCLAEKSSSGTSYTASSSLDACGTSISDHNGDIVFSNQLNVIDRVNPFGITTVTDVHIEYTCTFPRIVDVSDIATISNDAQFAGTDGTGVFEFDLTYYADATMTTESTEADEKIVGETVFFQIAPVEGPINGIYFTPTSCSVYDSQTNLSFDVLSNQCPAATVHGNNFGSQARLLPLCYSSKLF